MTSYLIISKDKDLLQKELEKICTQFSVHTLDRTVISKPDDTKPDKTRKTTKSIGIEDVKKMRQQIYLKPYKGKTKAVIFADSELLTPEAQNALLKVMEEPPEHTIILLAAKHKDAILPTVQSRCHIIELQGGAAAGEPIDPAAALFLDSISSMTIQRALMLD
jgi:DNA polymerase III gamma/tau subunit